MSVRFDVGEIRKPHFTHDGILLCEATFARDGILEYRTLDGKVRRELRLPEENKKALPSFGLAPLTIEHPSVLVTEDNSAALRKGISLQNVIYGKGGFVRGEVAIMDSDAIALATGKDKPELSAGYTCDVEDTPGVWRGQRYDAIQRNIRVNHIALTARGRAGPDVRLHLDSADPDVAYQVRLDTSSHTPSKPMATIRIDSVDYEIPQEIAAIVAPKLNRFDALEEEAEDLRQRVDSLEAELEEAINDRDHLQGRSDAQDILLANADTVLEELGYRRDSTGEYFRTDMDGAHKKGKKGKKMFEPDMAEDEEAEASDDDDEAIEEEYMTPKNKGKKGKKMDSAKDMLKAWKEADRLVPQLSETKFDSAETVADIQKLVIASLRPQFKLDGKTDAQIEVAYELIAGQPAPATQRNHNDSLSTAIAATRSSESTPSGDPLRSERAAAYQTPLALSKRR